MGGKVYCKKENQNINIIPDIYGSWKLWKIINI